MSVLMIYLRMERRGRERLDKSRGAHILEDFATNQLVWYYCHYWHYWHNWCYEIIHIMTNKVLFKANTKFVASLLTFLVLIVNSLQLHHTYKWMSALGSAMTALHWQPWRLDAALGRIGWVELAAGGWSGSNLVTGTGRVGCCTTQVVTNGEVKESFQHLRKFPPKQVGRWAATWVVLAQNCSAISSAPVSTLQRNSAYFKPVIQGKWTGVV